MDEIQLAPTRRNLFETLLVLPLMAAVAGHRNALALQPRPLFVEDFAALTFGHPDSDPTDLELYPEDWHEQACLDLKMAQVAAEVLRCDDTQMQVLAARLGPVEARALAGAFSGSQHHHKAFAETMEAAWTRMTAGVARCEVLGLEGFRA